MTPIAYSIPSAAQAFLLFSQTAVTLWWQGHFHLCCSFRKALFLALIEQLGHSISSEPADGQRLFTIPLKSTWSIISCLPIAACHPLIFWSCSPNSLKPQLLLDSFLFIPASPQWLYSPQGQLLSALASWCSDSSSAVASLSSLSHPSVPWPQLWGGVPLSRCNFQPSHLL